MSIETLKQTVASCVNDIFFDFNGKKCGIAETIPNFV